MVIAKGSLPRGLTKINRRACLLRERHGFTVGPMKTAYDIRRTNLRALVQELGSAKVIDRLGISKQQLSAYAGKNPSKNVGDAFARRIEVSLGLQEGWLDHHHDPHQVALEGVMELAAQLDEQQLQHLKQLLQTSIAISKKPSQNKK